ncbi:hypothetical protein Dimus_012162 [Dionaea muscipula]
MAISRLLLLIIAVYFLYVIALSTVDASPDFQFQNSPIHWMPSRFSTCRDGSIADCLADEEEFELDSEINRRILATSRYISYGSLDKNRIPCSRRGASYYNCRIGASANPYTRGCSAITRCRG